MLLTWLALDTGKIPDSTKLGVPTYSMGFFSNDGSRLLIDGKNEKGELVQSPKVLNLWLSGEPEETRQMVIDNLLESAIEYTREELEAERADPNSIWYSPPTGESDG